MDVTQKTEKCLQCKNPTCTNGCPLENDIPALVKLAQNGDFDGAVRLIGHPFGAICGLVCPRSRQCEGSCIRAKNGSPVEIGAIESYCFDRGELQLKVTSHELDGKKVAVVGAGVSGLTFAYKAYGHGASVTVYERDCILSTVKQIPTYRLDKQAIAKIENAFATSNVKFVYEDVSAEKLVKLTQTFDYVYFAVGAMKNRPLGLVGEQLATSPKQCLLGLNRGTVLILGGGNTAMDCATLSAKQGAKAVVAYRRSEADMPAFTEEIALAKASGVEFLFNVAPLEIGEKDGKKVLTLAKTVSQGRGKLEITDEKTEISCDSIVSALGVTAEDYGTLDAKNLYVGGDFSGGSLVVQAVKDALRVFDSIFQNVTN